MPRFFSQTPDGKSHYTSTEMWPMGSSAPLGSKENRSQIEELQVGEYAQQLVESVLNRLLVEPALARKVFSEVERYAKKKGYTEVVGALASDIATAFSRSLGKFRNGQQPSDWAYSYAPKLSQFTQITVQHLPKNSTLPQHKLIVRPPANSDPQQVRFESYTLVAQLFTDNPSEKTVVVCLPEGSLEPKSLSGNYIVTVSK